MNSTAFHPSARMQAVQSPVIPIVGDWVRSTPGAISLGQGVVWWGPPPHAVEAAQRALSDPQIHRYKPVEGIPDLVDAIEQKLLRENKIRVRPASRAVVTSGGNMAFLNAVLAVASPGEEIILNTPYYFNHDMAIEMAGCRTVCVETDANFQLDLEALRAAITPRTRAIVTVSPNNPSGAVYPESALRAVNELCALHGLFHIHDEAYDGFTYGVDHVSPGSFSGAEAHTISLFSLSKSFGFAGWRMGFMVVPSALFDAVKKIQDTNLICASAISQAAALGALSAGRDYFAPKVRELGAVREFVRNELESLSDICTIPQPQGAFYFLLKVQTALAPLAVVERLVKEHKVAVLPGSAFFPRTDGAACYLRLAYGALERDGVLEGVRRFTAGLRAVVKGN